MPNKNGFLSISYSILKFHEKTKKLIDKQPANKK